MTTVNDLTATSTLSATDIVYTIVDPSGSPLDRKAPMSVVALSTIQQRVIFQSNTVNTITNTNAETTMIGGVSVGSLTLAANYFSAGTLIKIKAMGSINTSASPPSLNIKLKFGSTVLASTGSTALTGNLTNSGWDFEAYIGCTTTGSSGAAWIMGWFNYGAGVRIPCFALNQVTINTTTTNAINLTGTWSETDSSDILNTMVIYGTREY